MNYFIEALEAINETDKKDILYYNAINIYAKRPSYHFLINIFIHVYNTNYCSLILETI